MTPERATQQLPEGGQPRPQLPLSLSLKRALLNGESRARAFGYTHVETEDLLLGVLGDPLARSLLEHFGVDTAKMSEHILLSKGTLMPNEQGEIPLAPRTKNAIRLAVIEARRTEDPALEPYHLLVGLAREEGSEAATVLKNFGITPDRAVELVDKARTIIRDLEQTRGNAVALTDIIADPKTDEGLRQEIVEHLKNYRQLAEFRTGRVPEKQS